LYVRAIHCIIGAGRNRVFSRSNCMGIDLDLRRLRFFVEVVQQGGFSQQSLHALSHEPPVAIARGARRAERGLLPRMRIL
jgi:hypothetical protein